MKRKGKNKPVPKKPAPAACAYCKSFAERTWLCQLYGISVMPSDGSRCKEYEHK